MTAGSFKLTIEANQEGWLGESEEDSKPLWAPFPKSWSQGYREVTTAPDTGRRLTNRCKLGSGLHKPQ